MDYKAIFLDVDGTLLTDDLTIALGSVKILSSLARRGLLICVVTARPPAASLFIYDQLGIPQNPIICFNGALILQENRILHEETIATPQLLQILEEVKGYVVRPSLYRHHDWLTEEVDRWVHQEMEITQTTPTQTEFNHILSADFRPNKILCMGESSEIDALEHHLKQMDLPDLNFHKSKPTYLEIMNRRASKSKGIERVISAWQVKREEIIAIGDNFNDLDMLRYAGTSVAMDNAPDEVKNSATFVTDSNNQEGILKALEKLIPL
ncbi:Cof-type HAD-IIB family hydrolase [Rufibacter roseolus]|uniref:Cof-type HAD-IIB family hydrolase n=1 Tax=Rufibacter roseolus TaxID=2817375 RepID=UPI001B302295|nr:Cof-type HAD-IIB family hydrolase [Rufibacter roseolus]